MEQQFIELVNARENNLKNVNLKIPKEKITVFTGVSGSGKSSIVFDTIAEEAGRQLNETYSNFIRLFLPKYLRPEADEIHNLSTAVVVDQKRLGGNARSTLGTVSDILPLFRLLFSRFAEPRLGNSNMYSFNDPQGMCPTCEGIGKVITLNVDIAIDWDKSLNEGAILLPGYNPGGYYLGIFTESGFFDNDKKLRYFTKVELHNLYHGEPIKIKVGEFNATYVGLVDRFMSQNVNTEKDLTKRAQKVLDEFTTNALCPTCGGRRYNADVLSSKINGYSIYDLTAIQLNDLVQRLKTWNDPHAQPITDRIIERVSSLCDVGLGYMTLDRETPTLSGGESQRVKMVKYLSSNLTGLLYIFDEPSTGLHPHDVYRLNDLLVQLRNKGNTVLVVEHDPDVIPIADYIVDVGPLAGSQGGQIMYSGDYQGLLQSDTLTAKFLNEGSPINSNPRPVTEFFECRKSSLHNLKNVSLRVPKGVFTVVTGVAGSGKSTLVNEVFAKDFPESLKIDQNPIHTNVRSNAATFIGIMNGIRKAFAKSNDVDAGLFSYNSSGACPTCGGKGTIELNMSFMEKVETECSECGGSRYRHDVLGFLYKGKSIVEVMDMTVHEALEFFEKDVRNKLKSLDSVGLSYLTLGQPLSTLSGGECQRLKLAKELKTGGQIYILDEPTTGLHLSDISNIIRIINELVDKGNTVIVIEHNIEVIRQSDWIIDIGPEGGTGGGQILYEGPPAGIKLVEESITAKYL